MSTDYYFNYVRKSSEAGYDAIENIGAMLEDWKRENGMESRITTRKGNYLVVEFDGDAGDIIQCKYCKDISLMIAGNIQDQLSCPNCGKK